MSQSEPRRFSNDCIFDLILSISAVFWSKNAVSSPQLWVWTATAAAVLTTDCHVSTISPWSRSCVASNATML